MNLRASARSTLVVIGNFDGVHSGHRALLGASRAEASARSLALVALTFDPHPSAVLGRGALPVLTTLERKLELLGAVCPELTVVVEPFTPELSQRSPEEFARGVLAEALGASLVVVGSNFRFGLGRSGDLQTLERLGAELGFEARAEALHGDAEGPFSSGRIRRALAAGDLTTSERLLGRPHALSGEVVHGAGRGRTIGVPTVNLSGVVEALPPYGVYAVLVDRLDATGARVLGRGVANIGERPTVGGGFSVEAHLFDFDGDLYGARLRLHLVARLREERRFPGIDALREQIARDMSEARAAVAPRVPSGDAWY
ncbi:MAG TPA: riboflavin biosynthesis protein RibF [Polyangiaceae bacterium]|nr:riboflavin biosynthesis protein RibF [Polyangiaceae bacterium]